MNRSTYTFIGAVLVTLAAVACDSDDDAQEVCCACYEVGEICPVIAESLSCESPVAWCRRVYQDSRWTLGCVDGIWRQMSPADDAPVGFDENGPDTCQEDLGGQWRCNAISGLCEDTPPPEPVLMTLKLVNASTGQGYGGVTVRRGAESFTTDTLGQARFQVEQGPYVLVLTADGARDHHLFGVAGAEPFTQITYMSPDAITQAVFGALGLVDDPAKGILVVGLDEPSLAPAVGATAVIDVLSGEPFVIAGQSPQFGHTILAGAQGFVSFPNVTPGVTTVTAELPGGVCAVYPAESGEASVDVVAGAVSILAFTCRAP